MQTVGTHCACCSQRIQFAADAESCSNCNAPIHTKCIAETCPICNNAWLDSSVQRYFARYCPACRKKLPANEPCCPYCDAQTSWANHSEYRKFVKSTQRMAAKFIFTGITRLAMAAIIVTGSKTLVQMGLLFLLFVGPWAIIFTFPILGILILAVILFKNGLIYVVTGMNKLRFLLLQRSTSMRHHPVQS